MRSLPGFHDPGALFRDGRRLYIGNTEDNSSNLVTVVDTAVVGQETIVDEIPTPLNLVDLAVVDGIVGLDGPSCSAEEPNFSVFRLADYSKIYRRDISGTCSQTILEWNGTLYVIFTDMVGAFGLRTGRFLRSMRIPDVGRNAAANELASFFKPVMGACSSLIRA